MVRPNVAGGASVWLARARRPAAMQQRQSWRTCIAGVHLPLIAVNHELVVQRQAVAVHLRDSRTVESPAERHSYRGTDEQPASCGIVCPSLHLQRVRCPCHNTPTCLPGGRQRGSNVRRAQPAEPGNHEQHALEALHAHGPALWLLQRIQMKAWQQVWAPRHVASAACTWPTIRRPAQLCLCAHRLAQQARPSGCLQ